MYRLTGSHQFESINWLFTSFKTIDPSFETISINHQVEMRKVWEKVQHTATRTILPDIEYEQCIQILNMPYLCDFSMELRERNLCETERDVVYSLHSHSRNHKGLKPKNVPNNSFQYLCLYTTVELFFINFFNAM